MSVISKGMNEARIIGIETAVGIVEIAIKYGKDPLKELKDYLIEVTNEELQ